MSFLPSLAPGNVNPVQTTSGALFDTNDNWQRPSEWLDLNVPTGVPEKIIGLVAVVPNNEGEQQNFVAFDLDTDDNSSFTVDWGDGTVETLTTDTNHYHEYDYDTLTGSSSTVEPTPFRGYRQVKFEIAPVGSASFSSVDFNKNGPYVTLTNTERRLGTQILDFFVSSSNNTYVRLADNINMNLLEQLEVRNTTSNRLTTHNLIYKGAKRLRSIPFVPYMSTSARTHYNAFAYCHALTHLPDDFADPDRYWFKNPSTMQSAFLKCYSLKHLPEGLFGDENTTWSTNSPSHYALFQDCRNLKRIPFMPNPNGLTDFRLVFYNCLDLKALPRGFSLKKVNSNGPNSAFLGCRECYDFTAINLDDLDVAQNFTLYRAFQNWDALKTFPYVGQFTKANSVRDCWTGATQIERFSSDYTTLDFTNVTSMRGTFQSMESLQELPPIQITNISHSSDGFMQCFLNCHSLRKVVFTGMTGNTSGEYYRMFWSCYSLTYIEGIDFSFANDAGDMTQTFYVVYNLSYIKFPGGPTDETGFKYSTQLRYCPLNRNAMLEIFNHLCTITHSATLDLRNNSYTADLTDDDKAIATNKGWTLSL
jgi:hypothetical protein